MKTKQITPAIKHRYKKALAFPITPELLDAKDKKPRYNPDQQRVLMFEVHHALTRGLTVHEVGALLDVSAATVEKLRDKAKRLDDYTFDIQTQEYVAKKFWLSCEDRVKKLWLLFEKRSTTAGTKVKCVALIHIIEQDMVKMGQSLGLIGKFDGEHDAEMQGKARALMDRYSAAVAGVVVEAGDPLIEKDIPEGGLS